MKPYMVLDLKSLEPVEEAIQVLQSSVGDLGSYNPSDDEKERIHPILAEAVSWLSRRVVRQEIGVFNQLCGQNLSVQRVPYLRIARPLKTRDNIGLHRDTWYGASKDEWSISIALTDQDAGSALQIGDLEDEVSDDLETVESGERGSVRHRLGFPYATKRLKSIPKTTPVPIKVGQALVFPIAALHGQVINTSNRTRFSTDARVCGGKTRVITTGEYYESLE